MPSFRGARSPSSSRTSRARRGCSRSSARRGTRLRWPSTVACCATRSRSTAASRWTRRATRSSSPSRPRPARSARPRRLRRRSRIPVRMGIHTGTPHVGDEGYVGMDVNRAARIAAAGHGGQVLVSASTRALVDGHELRDLGEHRLKDLRRRSACTSSATTSFRRSRRCTRRTFPSRRRRFSGASATLPQWRRCFGGRPPSRHAHRPRRERQDAAGAASGRSGRGRLPARRVVGTAGPHLGCRGRAGRGRPVAGRERPARSGDRRPEASAAARQLRARHRGGSGRRAAARRLSERRCARDESRAPADRRRARVSGSRARTRRGARALRRARTRTST